MELSTIKGLFAHYGLNNSDVELYKIDAEMNELYIPIEPPGRNIVNGRFLKGRTPHNKGKTMKYHSRKSKRRSVNNLVKGRGAWHKTGAGMNRKSVVAIRNGQLCGVFPSIQDAGKATGVSPSLISRICHKKPGRHKARGFEWFFENDNTWCDLVLNENGR